MRMTALLAATGLLVLALPLHAQNAPAPAPASYPEWSKLTSDQRQALIEPLRARWNANPDMRDQMFKHAQRWQRMSAEQREAANRGMRRWEGLTPEQRKAMHEQWKTMSPEQRKAWLEASHPAPPPAAKPAAPGQR